MVLADTGYWLALANRRDHWHQAAVAATRYLDEPLVVTWPVLTETCHLLLSRLGPVAQARFLQQVANVELHEISAERLQTLAALMEKYRDLPMDLADA